MRDEEAAAILASSSWDTMAKTCQNHEAAVKERDSLAALHHLVPGPYTEILLVFAEANLRRTLKLLT